MKLKEIEVGKTYYVRIPREVDEYLWMIDSPKVPRFWKREMIYAEVLEVDVEREVVERMTLGGIAGHPRVRSGSHSVPGGVRIRLLREGHDNGRVVVVPPRSIQWEVQT